MIGSMSNPAQVLHDIYSEWRARLDAGSTSMMGIVNLDTEEGGRAIAQAARALVEIDTVFRRLESSDDKRVALYRRQYPEWWKPLVSYHAGWNTAMAGSTLISEGHLDEIEACAAYLDGKVWEITPAKDADLRQYLADARKALETDTALSEKLRVYIHHLLREIQNALDDEVIGSTYDYGDAVMRLYVAFKAADGEDTPSRAIWRDLWTGIASGTVANALVAGAPAIVSAIAAAAGAN